MCSINVLRLVVAFGRCFIKPVRRYIAKKRPLMVFQNIPFDFLNGTVIVPFLSIIGSVFSKDLLEEAVHSKKLFFAMGGFVALLFVLKEYMKD